MKLTHLVLFAAGLAGGYVQAQTTAPSQAMTPAHEDRAVARACKADAQHLCAGKTGQEAQQCLKSNADKVSANCKEAMSKTTQPK
jgi:hypothetical protein